MIIIRLMSPHDDHPGFISSPEREHRCPPKVRNHTIAQEGVDGTSTERGCAPCPGQSVRGERDRIIRKPESGARSAVNGSGGPAPLDQSRRTRAVDRKAVPGGMRTNRRPEQSPGEAVHSPQGITLMRQRVRFIYLTLMVLSLIVIAVFAVLLHGKLKAVKEMPTEPPGYREFIVHPRITLPTEGDSALHGENEENEEIGQEDDEEGQASNTDQP